ncbi:MAG: methyltransferase domain-containing protein [Candidatus Harrisonbacteria bacterium]|nr:methyltransferase domain-containing protein [Candidatus Harrisonbacteria bacterium]
MKSLLNKIKNFLRCPLDYSAQFELSGGVFICRGCKKEYGIRDGKVIFDHPPSDVLVCTKRNPIDKTKWSEWRAANFEYLKSFLLEEEKNKILIDIGAGTASFRELTGSFKTTIGIDFYPHEMVDVVADVTKPLPIRDESCDIVFLSNVLEHIPEPQPLLDECYRILKPRGYIIGAVPFLMQIHQEPYDFNRYTDFMLERMLAHSGFERTRVTSLGTPLDVYRTMQREYFHILLNKQLSVNIFKNSVLQFAIRFTRKITYLFTRIYKLFPLLSSNRYTEGYGFIGYK